jgi:hypothetical protein
MYEECSLCGSTKHHRFFHFSLSSVVTEKQVVTERPLMDLQGEGTV